MGAGMSAQHKPGPKHPIYKGRSVEGICVLAVLVGYDVPSDEARLLTLAQLRELEVWAERTHLRASDNPVRVPPRPAWLPPKPWAGPEVGDDVFGGASPTPVDCAAIAKATGGAA
jgi:hypothetical protein